MEGDYAPVGGAGPDPAARGGMGGDVVTATRWQVHIPGYRPTTVNELLRSVRGRIALKKAERAVVGISVKERLIPPATGKRRVSLEIAIPKGQRRWDADGLWKSLLDALKHAKMIVNDSPDWVEQGSVTYLRGCPLATTIILEDLADGSV